MPDGTVHEFTYDGFGNRTSVKETKNGTSQTTNAAFNTGNQLTSFGSESITYDANGNRLTDGKYSYTWNAADQLIAVTNKGEAAPFATYKYDDDGRRIEKTVNGQTTRYYYDGDSINVLYETDANGMVLRQYVYSANGIRLAMKTQGQTFYYHYNPHGDVVAMTDQNNVIVAQYEYDAWGNILKRNEQGLTVDNPFTYAGYMTDEETGLYYLMARYYHPKHGVFLSMDPDPGDEDDPITQNGYTYADNHPVMGVDPDGHWVWIAVNAGFAAYDGYKAYKSGASWRVITKKAALGAVGSGRIKAVKGIGNVFHMVSSRNLRFTQDSIKGTFKNGKSVYNLTKALKSGKVSARNLPPIKVFKHKGEMYSFDNRRLYAAKQAGVKVRIQWASAREIQRELKKGKMTTKNKGKSIRVR